MSVFITQGVIESCMDYVLLRADKDMNDSKKAHSNNDDDHDSEMLIHIPERAFRKFAALFTLYYQFLLCLKKSKTKKKAFKRQRKANGGGRKEAKHNNNNIQ